MPRINRTLFRDQHILEVRQFAAALLEGQPFSLARKKLRLETFVKELEILIDACLAARGAYISYPKRRKAILLAGEELLDLKHLLAETDMNSDGPLVATRLLAYTDAVARVTFDPPKGA